MENINKNINKKINKNISSRLNRGKCLWCGETPTGHQNQATNQFTQCSCHQYIPKNKETNSGVCECGHVCLSICVCACPFVCICVTGCVEVWVCGCVGVWVCECRKQGAQTRARANVALLFIRPSPRLVLPPPV